MLDAWLCSNDSTSAGVAQAIESDYKGDNAVIVTGQDGDIAACGGDGKNLLVVFGGSVDTRAVYSVQLSLTARAMVTQQGHGESVAIQRKALQIAVGPINRSCFSGVVSPITNMREASL